jgi:hypothetical protein
MTVPEPTPIEPEPAPLVPDVPGQPPAAHDDRTRSDQRVGEDAARRNREEDPPA